LRYDGFWNIRFTFKDVTTTKSRGFPELIFVNALFYENLRSVAKYIKNGMEMGHKVIIVHRLGMIYIESFSHISELFVKTFAK
jgi:hypothetical protein